MNTMTDHAADGHQAAEVDPEALKNAQAMWHSFTRVSKWAVVVIALGVILLACITL